MPKATRSRDPNPSSPEPAPLRWGILGTGSIAHKFSADLKSSGAGELVACGSRTIEGARSFAAAHTIPRTYGSYGELARDPDVEAIYVATPHSLHLEGALACLRHGKAVLCEKPLTVNLGQATRLFEAAQTHGVILMEALWTYFLPALVQARRWWTEGQIGEVRLIEAEFGFTAPPDPLGRLLNPQLAGGALLDVGVYTVSLAQMVAGNRPPRIKASARMAATGVDESTSILLDWTNGPRANLSCSIAHRQDRPAAIHGTRGTITLPDFWCAKRAILENASGKTTFEDTRTTLGYDYEARAFTQAFRAGLEDVAPATRAFSLRLSATLDAVRKQIGLTYPGE